MSTELDIKIDHDIDEMLKDISKQAFLKRLVIFNDDTHGQEEVLILIMQATEAAGKPVTPQQALKIMMEAHTKGQAIVMSGELEPLKIAQEILDAAQMRTDII